jgi:gamma-glutamyl hercynylcysteine S-oxide hydrolase
MCRHLAYVGPPVALASLLYEPPQSLVRQSWAPRQQRFGTVNADGYGVGWYQPSVRAEPARFRRAGPMWADRSLESLARLVVTGAFVAAVRSATPPAPIEETGAAPFTEGPWLFSLNGVVKGDLMSWRRLVSPSRQAGIEGASDAEVLFALLLDRLDEGDTPGAGLAHLVTTVPGRLNLLLSDGVTVWATAWGDTLWWRPVESADGPGTVVASEPLDDHAGWTDVADRSLLTATTTRCTVESLSPKPVTPESVSPQSVSPQSVSRDGRSDHGQPTQQGVPAP